MTAEEQKNFEYLKNMLAPGVYKFYIELIDKYARKQCKEQRKLCSKAAMEFRFMPSLNEIDLIRKAPEPNFE